jgi:hypothetical protein
LQVDEVVSVQLLVSALKLALVFRYRPGVTPIVCATPSTAV